MSIIKRILSRKSAWSGLWGFIFVIIFLSQIACIHGQNQQKIDSLKQVVNTSGNDTAIIRAYYYWGDEYWKSKPDTAIKYYQKSKEKAINFLSKHPKSKQKKFVQKSLSEALNDIGFVYSRLGDVSNALEYYHESLKVLEEVEDKKTMSETMNNLGFVYYQQENLEKALEYYKKSLELKKEIGNQEGIATSYNNIGGVYEKQGDYRLAEEFYTKSYKIREGKKDKLGMSVSLNNIGAIYTKKNDQKKAYEYFSKSLKIQEELGDKRGMAISLLNIGKINLDEKNIVELKQNATRSYLLSRELGYPEIIQRTAQLMKDLALLQKDYQLAYQFYQEEIQLKDSVTQELNKKTIYRQQAKYEYQKRAAIDSIAHARELEIKENEQKQQVVQRNMFLVGLILAVVLMFIILRFYRQKKKANILLENQNEEITAQRDEIELKKGLLEEIHRDVSESIDYATRLQQSILPDTTILEKHLSDHFVFFKPKDKVSGDFYWWTHVENHTVITAADCTGHGVPGAFMSMLGVSFLREIVQKEYVTHTGVILRKLRKEIVRSLKQKGKSGEQKDGMDMALISINHENNVLQFSGANNPLYIITNSELQVLNGKEGNKAAIKLLDNSEFKIQGSKLFYEVKPDKMPIAIYEKMDKFTHHEIQLNKGDQLYMFSDGFPDQFGGVKGKKFKYKPFKSLLLENSGLPMAEQQKILNKTFEDWKGQFEQIDDIVVVGIRV